MQLIRRRSQIIGLLSAIVLLGFGCNIVNPTEIVPTYVRIDSFVVERNPLMFPPLSTSHNINNISVYYNNSPIGNFDLPATIPVMATGNGKLQIAPGIVIDGRNDLITQYPYYTLDTLDLVAQPGKTITHVAKTKYYTFTKPQEIAYFDLGATDFSKWGGNKVMVAVTDDSLVFEGGGSGAIYLTAVGDSSIDSSSRLLTIPLNGASYIEFNYNSTIPFYVGMQANLSNVFYSSPYFLAGIRPNYKWQKFYLNVSSFAAQYQATSYNFYVKAVLADGQSSGRLLLDNIQLITF